MAEHVLYKSLRTAVRCASLASDFVLGRTSGAAGSAGARATSASSSLPEVVRDKDESLVRALVRPHPLGGLAFDMPWAPGACRKSLGDFVRMGLGGKAPPFPTPEEVTRDLPPPVQPDLEAIASHSARDPMRVTWVGHSTVLLQIAGVNVLTDPVFSDSIGPLRHLQNWPLGRLRYFGMPRYTPAALSVKDLPALDVVLISHAHHDHLDAPSVKRIGNGPLWIVPVGTKRFLKSWGISNCVEVNWWDHVPLVGGKIKVVSFPAQHWSNRTAWDINTSLWCSYGVISEGERFFFAGDTAMAPIYKQIAQRYGPFDIAALPIGAYEPRWFYSTKHSSPSEALQIHRDLNCRRSVAVHWGTFALAMDGHVEPPRHLVSSAARMGMPPGEFEVLRHGESIVRGQKRLYPCSWQQELE